MNRPDRPRLRPMAARLRAAMLLAGLVATAGCTATLATVRIVKANKQLAAARSEGAEALAPYELTLATSYVDKAREEFADGQHGAAMEFADLAATTARLATDKATGRPTAPPPEEEEALTAGPADPERIEGLPDDEVADTDPLADAFEAPEDDEPAPWEGEPEEATP